MWKHFFICSILLLIAVYSQPEASTTEQPQTQYYAKVGEYITGRIVKDTQETVMHHFQLDKELPKKYLFLRLKSSNVIEFPVISVYNDEDRSLIKTCSLEEYPECYLRKVILKPNQKIIIVVSAKSDANYNLQTYWGDLQHLTADSELSFMFDKNTSQLFHLEFGNQKFEQIRIILEPITGRQDYDKLKMFLNFGTDSQPTSQEHDLESIRVWSDSEALFLSKEQTKGQDSVFLYIVGNAQTIYKLRCEFVRQTHHDLQVNEVLYEYLEGKNEYVYHINGSKLKEYDEYAFKFSVFHGEIGVTGYEDLDLTKAISQKPFQYMSDLGLYFTKEELINNLKNLYIKVWCPDASATYEISLQGRNFNLASEITEDIFQFIALKEGKKAFYFKYPVFNSQEDQSTKKNSLIFSANVIRVLGTFKLNFYACNEVFMKWNNCVNVNNEQVFTKSVEQLEPISMPEVGSKTLYTLEVPDKYLKETVKVAKQVMIIAVFMNGGENTTISAIEFSNPNKVKRIREDKAIEEQILGGYTRFYKYENSDPDVQAVQIHYNHISGSSITKVSREDPRLQSQKIDQQSPGQQGSTVFQIKENLVQPIYVAVHSLSNTIFTLSATVKHKLHADSSALTLAEDIPYKFKIYPFESKLIEIHPIEGSIIFQYKSVGGPIFICETLYNGVCDQKSDLYVNSSTNGEISINSEQKRSIKLRIFNSLDPKTNEAPVNSSSEDYQLPNRVEVEVLYHAEFQNHCQQRKMSEVYSDVFKSGQCIKFHIDRMASIQIMTHKQDIGMKFQVFYLCSVVIQPIYRNDRYFIPKSQIENTCTQSANDMTLMILLADPTRKYQESIRYQYAVEYERQGVVLKDGISYTVKGISAAKESAIKNFYYELIDVKKSTEIILFNHKGTQRFYASILSNQTKLHTEIYENFAMISSQESTYYSNPEMEVTPQIIKSSKCSKNCMLVVSVFSEEPIGTQVEFTMEITSSSVVLGEDQIHNDFIGTGTYQYYRYQVRKTNESLYIRVSDSNAHCSKIYISDKQYPSPSNVMKSSVSGELVLNYVKKDSYYIGVQALEDCMYSISVSESSAHITKMEYGQFYDIKLNEDQIKYFLVRHISIKPFKILTLQKHGSLQIYANQVQITQNLIEEVEAGKIQYADYNFKSQYRNTLVVGSDQNGFCSDCHYLVVVVAKKLTDSSIVLMGENAKLSLPKDKILFDSIVDENTETSVDFYTTTSGKMMTKVHQGEIKIELSYGAETQSYTFDRNKKIYYTDYSFQENENSFEPIRIKISAITTPALYSFKMNPNTNETSVLHMTPGQHSYLYLSEGREECIGGYLRDKNEVIYLTVSSEEDLKLNKLIMTYRLKGELTDKVHKEQIGNIMELRYQLDSEIKGQAMEYEICLKFDDSDYALSMVAFQNEAVNILPMNTEVLIRKSNKFVFHPNGELLLDLFVCEGELDIRYAPSEEKLKEDTSHDLQKVGIPGQSHAIKISEYQTIFLQVQASEATMNWMPLNTEKQLGIGYFSYGIGNIQYKSSFNELTFQIGGVSQLKETKTEVYRIRYTLYIAESTENLNRAIMCEKFGDSVTKFISTYQGKNNSLVNKTITMKINKKKITDTFHKNTTLFYNVVADMILTVPNQSKDLYTQNYKFIYFPQQVSAEVFMQNIIESTNIQMATILVIVGVVGFLIVSCVFIKIIVPAIGRIRNRMFVEQNNDRDQSIPIPPSSDRNQVNDMKGVEMQEAPVGTEEQMKK